MIMLGKNFESINATKRKLQNEFEMKNLEELKYFLKMQMN